MLPSRWDELTASDWPKAQERAAYTCVLPVGILEKHGPHVPLGAAGLEALSFLTRGVAAPAEWRAARLATLDEAAKPKAALEFPVIPALRQLVVAAAELRRLQEMPPAEWKAQVRTLAAPPAKQPGR